MSYTLITGATSGIGLEFAKMLAKRGNKLLLVSRNQDKLERVKVLLTERYGTDVDVFEVDLSVDGQAEKVYEWTQMKGYRVDMLINNAGFGDYGRYHETTLDKTEAMIRLNVLSLAVLCHLYLPEMVRRREGYIMNVASVAAFAPGPMMANYYATKAYVLSLTEAIATEVKGDGVKVVALCPGPTITNFQHRANIGRSNFLDHFNERQLTARQVARYGYDKMMAGEVVIIPGQLNHLSAFAGRHAPKKIIRQFMTYFQGEKE